MSFRNPRLRKRFQKIQREQVEPPRGAADTIGIEKPPIEPTGTAPVERQKARESTTGPVPAFIQPQHQELANLNDHELLQWIGYEQADHHSEASLLKKKADRFKRYLGQFEQPFGQFSSNREMKSRPHWMKLKGGLAERSQLAPNEGGARPESGSARANDPSGRIRNYKYIGVENPNTLLPFRNYGDSFEFGTQEKPGI